MRDRATHLWVQRRPRNVVRAPARASALLDRGGRRGRAWSSRGGWPSGMLSHVGAAGADGGFIVFDVWATRESQEAWMASQLGPALGQAGVAQPTHVEWLSVAVHYQP
jgi:hypothetical protein